MSKLNTFQEQINKIQETILLEIEKAKEENPKINRINSKCFTINHSQLDSGLNLSPFHYDWIAQYNQIIEIIKDRQPKDSLNIISRIIKEKRLFINGTTHWFCKDVINKLQTVFN